MVAVGEAEVGGEATVALDIEVALVIVVAGEGGSAGGGGGRAVSHIGAALN